MIANWTTKQLKDVCIIRPHKNAVKKILRSDDHVSFAPMNKLGIDKKYLEVDEERALDSVYKGYTYFADKDVLLAKITPCFENGKLGIAKNLTNGIGFGSSEYVVYRPSKDILSSYLYYFLNQQSFRDEGVRLMTGAVGHKRIPKEFYEKKIIPIPPLSEQEQIVTILDEAFEVIDKAKANVEKNLQNAKDLFQSKLNRIFTQKGNDWEEVTLSEMTTDITDGDHMAPPKSKEGVPFITISNINKQSHIIDFSETFFVPRDYYNNLKDNRKPKKGDLLYTVTGSFGIPVMVDFSKEFCFQRHIGLIRPNKNTDTRWLYYWVLSPLAIKQANEKATGTAQRTVSLKALRSFKIPKVPYSQQLEMVKALNSISREVSELLSMYLSKNDLLEELKKSILQKAFSGELTNKEMLS